MDGIGGCDVDVIRRMVWISCSYVDGARCVVRTRAVRCGHVVGPYFGMVRNKCVEEVGRWCDVRIQNKIGCGGVNGRMERCLCSDVNRSWRRDNNRFRG